MAGVASFGGRRGVRGSQCFLRARRGRLERSHAPVAAAGTLAPVDPDRERPPEEPDPFPDPRPLRRIQLATAALIAVAGAVTLLSDQRPAVVRWSAAVGIGVLI